MKNNISRVALLLLSAILFSSLYLGYWQMIGARELTENPEVNRLRQMEAESRSVRGRFVDRHGEAIVWSQRTRDGPVREYGAPALVHVVGYHSHRFGDSNLEGLYGNFLGATAGLSPQYQLRSRLLDQPLVGADVALTIDAKVQREADSALGSASGSVVVINPRTGEIIAMVSHPAFAPAAMESDWENLREDTGRPLVNRATQGLYVTGSTFKTITLAAALDRQMVSSEDVVECPAQLSVEGFNILTERYPSAGDRLDVTHAYAYSCNTAFASLGLRLGGHRLTQYADFFGFDQEPPIEIGSVPSRLFSTPDFLLNPAALASTSFGQGEIQATPLQMALVASAIANYGAIQRPYLVSSVTSAEGNVLYQAEPGVWLQAVKPETASRVALAMVTAVSEGWSHKASISGVTVGGKTGTGEVGGGQKAHAWFIGFAPAENPQVAIVVIVENGGSGPEVAAPIAKRVIEAALADNN